MKKSISTFLKHPTKDSSNRSANPPVTRASTILFNSMQELLQHEKKIKANKKISYYSYGRYGSSTTIELENILKELEQAYHVFLTGTGFGGVALAIMSLCRPGDEILVSDNVYGPTKEISADLVKEFNINAKFYNPDSFEDLKNKATKKTKMILVENPGSNTFEFQDLKKILSFAKNKNIYTAIDNTWGTPYLIKPLDLGFDMSIVSATKYYSGHSDVMGGSLAIKKRLFKEVELSQKAVGLRLSPDDAYLIMRGLRTLDIRLDKHQENTIKVANFLSKQKKVKEVFYPIKKNIKQYKMWKKYYSGSSGLMGVKIISKNKNSVIKFLNKLKLFAHGYSWGGFESLALYQDKLALGNRSYTKLSNNEHIIRLHIGLEDPNDLIADIKQAIKSVR